MVTLKTEVQGVQRPPQGSMSGRDLGIESETTGDHPPETTSTAETTLSTD